MVTAGRRIPIWIFAGLLVLGLLVFAANAGKMLVVNDPERSDVIVVLAGETELRPALGLELLRQGYGRRLLIDVPGATKIYGLSQVELAEKYVQSLPEGASIAICPIAGLSTKDESHDVAHCLVREGGVRILLVTSAFHTRRALSIFRHELQDKTFSVASVRDEREFGTHWWRHREWAKTCLEEWLKSVWWNAVDRWR